MVQLKALASVVTLIIFSSNVSESTGAKILNIAFAAGKSHFLTYKPLLRALAERGHEVTIVSPVQPGIEHPNVKFHLIHDMESNTQNVATNLFEFKEQVSGAFSQYTECVYLQFFNWFEGGCRLGYDSPILEEIKKEKYDLVIFTPMFNECLYGFIHELNTTVVLVSQFSLLPWTAESFGAPTLPSFVPLLYYGFPDEMSFMERVINFLGIMYYQAVRRFVLIPFAEKLYREKVNPNAPSVREIEGNASLVLVNSHINLIPPRPTLPEIIEVGGMHFEDPKPLPKDLQDFCDGAEHGVIYFSMGSFIKSSTMPEKYRLAFVRTFARLKQRIIWKWETDSMPDAPPNVKLSKWVPQQDLLAHKNIRLFLTHGGHGSTTEALWHGIPLVGIPMFSDQYSNMMHATHKGFALTLQLVDVTEERLYEALMRVLTEPSFRERAKFLSQIYHDSQVKPLDRAIYWVEYVLRYGGATHLRSAARKLNFFQYFSLDVMAFLVTVFIAFGTINVSVFKALFRKLVGRSIQAKQVISKKKSQ